MRKLLTHSAMMMFLSCRQKYVYRQMQNIVPSARSTALVFGTAVHAGLECWFKTHDVTLAVDAAMSYAELDLEDSIKAGELVRRYTEEYADDAFTVLGVEQKFEVPLKHPETKRRSPLWNLAGKADGLVTINDEIFILEHKTTSNINEDYWARVDIDCQIMTYAIALQQQLKKPVAGAIFDVLKKPMIRMKQGETDEEFEQRQRESKTGKVKRKVAETVEEFAERVQNELKPTDFARKTIRFSQSDLYDHWTRLWELSKDMTAVEKQRGCVYRNSSLCLGFNTCPYLKLCRCNGNVDLCKDDYTYLQANSELQ